MLPCPHHEGTKGEKSIASFIANFSIRWRWVINFMLPPLCPKERTLVPIEYKAWSAPGLVLAFLRREKSLGLARIQTLYHPANSLVTILTALPQPPYTTVDVSVRAMKEYSGCRHIPPPRRGELSNIWHNHFTPKEGTPSNHWIGVWVDPEAVLMLWCRKNICPARNWNPDLQLSHHTNYAILAPSKMPHFQNNIQVLVEFVRYILMLPRV
jgi:hypothetical protein